MGRQMDTKQSKITWGEYYRLKFDMVSSTFPIYVIYRGETEYTDGILKITRVDLERIIFSLFEFRDVLAGETWKNFSDDTFKREPGIILKSNRKYQRESWMIRNYQKVNPLYPGIGYLYKITPIRVFFHLDDQIILFEREKTYRGNQIDGLILPNPLIYYVLQSVISK